MKHWHCAALIGISVSFVSVAGAQVPDKGSIEGTVLNATNSEPVKKAHVSVRLMGPANAALGATTDAAGHYAISNLDPGRYMLSVSHAGFVNQNYGAKSGRPGKPLVLEAGGKLTEIDFHLTQQGVITGRTLDEDGDPLPFASVQCLRYQYVRGKKELFPVGGSNSNDLGEYRIYGLAPGKYYVSATSRDASLVGVASDQSEEGYATVFYPNTTTVETAAALDVTPGAQLRGIDLSIPKIRAMHVKGRVVDANNRPVLNGAVSLMSRDTGAGMRVSRLNRTGGGTDNKGNFEVHGVMPGAYVLLANAMEDKTQMIGRALIDVGASSVEGIVVTVAAAPEVNGKLILEGKTATKLNSINVYLEPKGPAVMGGAGGQTDPEGHFVLHSVVPESYLVNVFGLTGNVYLKAVRFGDTDVTDTGLDFSSGVPPGELTVVLSANGGQVSGVVQNDKQQPVSGAQVVLIPEDSKRNVSRLYHVVSTDASGNFKITGIAPGEYKLFAWEQVDNNAWQDPEFLKPFESRAESVTVKEGSIDNRQLKAVPAEETKQSSQ